MTGVARHIGIGLLALVLSAGRQWPCTGLAARWESSARRETQRRRRADRWSRPKSASRLPRWHLPRPTRSHRRLSEGLFLGHDRIAGSSGRKNRRNSKTVENYRRNVVATVQKSPLLIDFSDGRRKRIARGRSQFADGLEWATSSRLEKDAPRRQLLRPRRQGRSHEPPQPLLHKLEHR